MTITPEHERALSYHPPTEGRADLAFNSIQAAAMWANAAIAIHDPNASPGRPGDDLVSRETDGAG